MTPEEWDRVKDGFEAALGVPEPERDAFIREMFHDQPVVRDCVIELVAHHTTIPGHSRSDEKFTPVLSPNLLVAGRFRIIRFIAAGGMGEVYEAYDEWLRLRLALKTIRPELLSDSEALNRFKRELLVARAVAHENLCRVYDFAEHRSHDAATRAERTIPCFTMELLEGDSLADILSRRRPLPLDEALPLVKQIAGGLHTLHEHGIVHRDLKPSNIMIVPRDNRPARAVVTDFGLAKRDGSESDLFRSAPDFQGGAPFFMAPELLQTSKPSVASDVYSFGLIVDEMVTRSPAFSSTTLQSFYYEKLFERPSPPSARSEDLPRYWEQTILTCLSSDPGTRFSSVLEASRRLEAPVAHEATSLSPLPAISSAPGQGRRKTRRWAVGALIATPVAGASAAIAALALQTVNSSIQVFEIENRTGQPNYDYLCKGTTTELMRLLLELEGVRVFAMHSPRSAVAQKIGRFALDGMLQVHNQQLRLSVALADNEERGALVWSANFERDGLGDPLALQSDIARNTVSALERRVLLGPVTRTGDVGAPLASAAYRVRRWFALQTAQSLPAQPTRSNVAFDLYMRGHALLEELSPQAAEMAVDYFKRAIEEDSQFALAYSATADAYMARMNYNYAPHPELAHSARFYANRAVELDGRIAETHAVLAAVRQMDWDWKGAEESYRRALDLKPNLARARRWYAGLVLQFGRYEEALREAQRALELDSLDRSAAPAVGLYLFFAGKYTESIDMLRRALAKKDMPMTRHNLGQVYAWLAHVNSGAQSAEYRRLAIEQAKHIEAQERTSSEGRTSFSDQLFALTYSLAGDVPSARVYLDRLEADMYRGGTSPVTVGWIYAILREADKSCDLLERAASWRDRRLLYSKVIPFLSNLRGFPRFESLLRQMNLT